jgi:hypothetical protein
MRQRADLAVRIGGVQEFLLPVEETLVEQDGGGRAGHRHWDDESTRLESSLPFRERSRSRFLTLTMALLEDFE